MEGTLVNQAELEVLRQNSGEEKDIKFVAGPATISSVPEWSLAAELELKVGDQILAINNEKFRDIFDLQFKLSQLEQVELLIKHNNSDQEVIEFDKDLDEELGVEYETPLYNGIQECANKCAFCFIDQQPMELTRKSLHLKDDDFRLSYLHGSYVTLTNLSRSDRKRIEELRPGPLYISVHATDNELRNKLLGRKNSTPIVDELKWLDSLDIPCHTQIVLCPGWNDGDNLIQTLNDLYELKDKPIVSVAIVPVGLTKYHNGGLTRFTQDDALETISLIEEWNKEKGYDFAFLSDEFYLMTNTPIPKYEDYGGYPQLEDGVGVTSLFLKEFKEALKDLPSKLEKPQTVTWLSGTLAKNTLEEITQEINSKVENLTVNVASIDSEFWGITNVTGLLTGADIIKGLQGYGLDKLGDKVIVPKVMLKDGTEIFLDDLSIQEVEKEIKTPCKLAWGAQEFVESLIS